MFQFLLDRTVVMCEANSNAILRGETGGRSGNEFVTVVDQH